MSDSPVDAELKGGHAPAVKTAGGVRITQHKPKADGEAAPPAAVQSKEEDEQEEEQQVATKAPQAQLLVSGVVAQGNKDFPPEAIKAYHEKPHPTKDNRPAHPPVRTINQPRKQ